MNYINIPAVASKLPGCRFWNTSGNAWSSEGCTVVERGTDYIVCACTHLTSFQAAQLAPPFRPLELQVWALKQNAV